MLITPYKKDSQRIRENIFTMRFNIFLAILGIAVLFTALQPNFLIDWFNHSYVELLTRLWIIASLLSTFILTFLANKDLVKRTAAASIKDPERNKLFCELTAKNSGWNSLVGILIFAIIIAAIIPHMPILVINLLAGATLVSCIMKFDWCVIKIYDVLVMETISLKPDYSTCTDKEKEDFEKRLSIDVSDYNTYRSVFWKLDLPILCGMIIIFFVGQLLLPHVVPEAAQGLTQWSNPYLNGFTSGATALQILVGNISFGIIAALQE